MVDWLRIEETRGWHRGLDGRSLKLDLRRRLSPAVNGVRLLLQPEPSAEGYYRDLRWWKSELPPCRLVWVGDLVAARSGGAHLPALEALVELTKRGGAPFKTVTLPISLLPNATVARVLRESTASPPRSIYSNRPYAGPGPPVRFPRDQWRIELWLDRSGTVVVTAEEIPALAIATLAGYPPFQSAPCCVVADRRARRVVVVPCWEILRFYYAQTSVVRNEVFGFPSWGPETARSLLGWFDGHVFCAGRRRKVRRRGRWHGDYAARQLAAIGHDAAVAFMLTGRAQIRAMPPFRGSTRLLAVGVEAQLGEFAALFVQQILESEPWSGGPGVIRWKKEPWSPRPPG
jgi:hypothetical protein